MISSLDEAVRQLRTVPGLGFTTRPFLLLPLLRTGCLEVLLSSQTADRGWAERFGVELHAGEELTGVREDTNVRGQLDRLLAALPERLQDRWRGREFALATYTPPRAEWQAALAGAGAHLLLPRPQPSAAVMTDKIAMRDWFRGLGLTTPADTVVGELDGRALRRRFGERYVVQLPRGSGGQGTFLVDHAADGEQALHRIPASPDGRWLVSEYAGDVSLNFHGLVGADGSVSVLRPSLQLTGVAGIGAAFGWYSGCDFGAPALLPPTVPVRGAEAVERIGWGLAELGYRGVFGADVVVRGESITVLEVNCRLQGSTWLLGELELAERRMPTLLRHVLERRGQVTLAKPAPDPAPGVQLTVRHRGPAGRVAIAPGSGVHALADGVLHRRADGYGLLECGEDDCVVLQVPPVGTLVRPGTVLARLVCRRPLTTPDGRELAPDGRQLVDALYARFAVEPC
ncbi:hypothetical protein GCM10010441_64300 [Kitasatospora paracochleata]|uniref:ATP-grasp domain-containing protein n=1 Tax=Kitasatospora paracochleata TaxID=58354 RepID=A0ABT1IUI0_9ACTN|nr:ATP-grasp domain-containing protein [Kitasatospora paracochleata]MCP2308734.1 hypothetical protein [Kitasatospora paracochleata]